MHHITSTQGYHFITRPETPIFKALAFRYCYADLKNAMEVARELDHSEHLASVSVGSITSNYVALTQFMSLAPNKRKGWVGDTWHVQSGADKLSITIEIAEGLR